MNDSAKPDCLFNPNLSIEKIIQQEDQTGLESIYEKYAPSVYSLVLSIHPNPATAEGIVEKVFRQAWLRIGDFDGSKGSLFTWIYSIARQECIAKTGQSGGKVAEEAFAGVKPITDLKSLINKLAEPYRGVLLMSYFENAADNDIEDRLNLTEVRQIRHRALVILSRLIAQKPGLSRQSETV